MPDRRQLTFADWEAVRKDLRDLSCGYEQHGRWNLEQAARHLNEWLRYPMDGFPPAPFPLGLLLAAMRVTRGASLLKRIIAEGRMPDGSPTSPNTVYPSTSEVGQREAVAQLEATIDRFQNFGGAIHPSPLFGAMDKQTAEKLQFVHFAHHLSWLRPVDESTTAG